ncbi:hypothetical protein SNEBB_003058 [Seison nebaliae]|nr:hypothetical protein SNEBB_003058 [Seison nebaliae]
MKTVIDQSVKLEKELLVSHNSGDELYKVCLLVAIPVLSHLPLELILNRIIRHYKLQSYLKTLLKIIISMVFYEKLNEYILHYFIVMSSIIFFYYLRNNQSIKNEPLPNEIIRSLRSDLLIVTSFCIFAVDFPTVFPRSLIKTELTGISFMDVGVGMFMLINGMSFHRKQKFSRITYKILFLLLVGTIRSISIQFLNYQNHITEYGIHWNFFFTLAIGELIGTILWKIFNINSIPFQFILSFILILSHEFLLRSFGVYGLNPTLIERLNGNLILQNIEGISSLLGYVSLYMLSYSFKELTLSKKDNLQILNFSYFILFFISLSIIHFIESSRRLCNISYILIVFIIFQFNYFLYYLIRKSYSSKPIDHLSRLVNKNGLLFFLFSNLLTGLGNIFLDTIHMTPKKSFFILYSYMIVQFLVFELKLALTNSKKVQYILSMIRTSYQ